MITFDDRNEVTIQNPPAGKAILFYDEDVLKLKDENGDIRIVTLADSIENAVSSGDYYTNSYVERLKALGSNVQYSNYLGTGTGSLNLTDGRLYLYSLYIPKISTINGFSWYQTFSGDYTADNYNGVGLYSYDLVNEKLTLITSTDDDPDIWKTPTLSVGNKNFELPVTINSGIYYIGFLWNASATVQGPIIIGHNTDTTINSFMNTYGLSTAKLNGYLSGQNTLPSEILNTDILSNITHNAIVNLY